MLLQELHQLIEAKEQNVVVAKLVIYYQDSNLNDKQGAVTLYHTCTSAEEATKLADEMRDTDVDANSKKGDLLNHWGQNAFNNFDAAVGEAYFERVDVKAVAPKEGRKCFEFKPKDLGF